ncbi:MAG: histidinol-phosphate transaminase [Bacillota bacterium]|nr:histidinol-phosphate transaminase [Bacillota bacterium]
MANWTVDLRRGWREGLGGGRLRLKDNESPWDLPPELKLEILRALGDLPFSRYDFALRPRLLKALADYTGAPPEAIVPGNGADELIQLCQIALSRPGTRVICTSPTFVVYGQVARALRLPFVDVPLRSPGFGLPASELADAAGPGDIVFLCRPNNPTGNVFPRQQVIELVSTLEQRDARVIVDEAYFEFCGETMADEVIGGGRKNLVILRTMSKAFRLAGLRLGYAIASGPMAQELERARLLYNVSAATMVAGLGVLANPQIARRTAAALNRLRDLLAADLSRLPGVLVHPSQTNFMLLSLPCRAEPVVRALAARGIIIRHYPGEAGLERSVRVSVGNGKANLRVAAALGETLTALAAPPAAGGSAK